jgi:hypothetical protein
MSARTLPLSRRLAVFLGVLLVVAASAPATEQKKNRIPVVIGDENYTTIADRPKAIVPRCLTNQEREEFGLLPDAPRWCFDLSKWPYGAQAVGPKAAPVKTAPAENKSTPADAALKTDARAPPPQDSAAPPDTAAKTQPAEPIATGALPGNARDNGVPSVFPPAAHPPEKAGHAPTERKAHKKQEPGAKAWRDDAFRPN